MPGEGLSTFQLSHTLRTKFTTAQILVMSSSNSPSAFASAAACIPLSSSTGQIALSSALLQVSLRSPMENHLSQPQAEVSASICSTSCAGGSSLLPGKPQALQGGSFTPLIPAPALDHAAHPYPDVLLGAR